MQKDEEPQKKKQKSFLETVREIDEKERLREEAAEAARKKQIEEQKRIQQEAYDKRIREERIELMRLKQGVITESETIFEQKEEKPKRSLWKRIGDFFYHNKWWLIITTCIVGIFTFLTVDYLMKVRPDLIVMVLTDDETLQFSGAALEQYFTQFTEDVNGDGKVKVDIYPIPVNDRIGEDDYYTGNGTKLTTQFQMSDAVLLITDAKANQYILAEETLVNLEELFPDCKNIRGNGFYLRNSDFMQKLGYGADRVLDRDICMSLRKVTKTTFDSIEEMQEHYNVAYDVFQQVMEDLPYVQKNRTSSAADNAASETEGE